MNDFQIWIQCKPTQINNTIQALNTEIDSVHNWFQSHCFQLNHNKTQSIILGTRQAIVTTALYRTHSLIINGANLPFQSSVKNLGVQIEQDLTWQL